MPNDWNKPDTSSNYSTEVLQELKERDDAAVMMDLGSMTNIPTNAKRWEATNQRFENWNGTAWVELTSLYKINVEKLNGQLASFYRDAANLNAGILPAGRFDNTSHGNRGGGALHAQVTTSADGFMIAADKTKLDGVETGATADQTASEILNLIKTVDGAGSGLDADLLDGQHGSYYAQAHSHPYASTGHSHSDLVTNGNSHDHAGGDGAPVPNGGLATDAVTANKINKAIGTSNSQIITSGSTWTPAAGFYNMICDDDNTAGRYLRLELYVAATWRLQQVTTDDTNGHSGWGSFLWCDGTNMAMTRVGIGSITVYWQRLYA